MNAVKKNWSVQTTYFSPSFYTHGREAVSLHSNCKQHMEIVYISAVRVAGLFVGEHAFPLLAVLVFVVFPPAPKKGMVKFSRKGHFSARRHAKRAHLSAR